MHNERSVTYGTFKSMGEDRTHTTKRSLAGNITRRIVSNFAKNNRAGEMHSMRDTRRTRGGLATFKEHHVLRHPFLFFGEIRGYSKFTEILAKHFLRTLNLKNCFQCWVWMNFNKRRGFASQGEQVYRNDKSPLFLAIWPMLHKC